MAKAKFPVGSSVKFLGYDEAVEDADRMLEEGAVYVVMEDNPDNESVAVQIDNPDFNKKKKESEENAKTVLIDVFYDEVEAVVEGKGKGKKVAAPVEDDADDDTDTEAEVEEEAPPPKTKAKPAAKGKKAVEPVEEEEQDEPVAPKAKAGKTVAVKKDDKKAKGKTKAKGKLAAKAKAEDTEPEDKYPALEEEDEEITELVDGADLIELANELVSDSNALDYKLGGVLYHLRLGKSYEEVDAAYAVKGGWQLFIEAQLPGLGYRKAMHLIDIYYTFNLNGIDAEKVAELGWTKCAKIAAVMTPENAEELVELAGESSVAELSDTIKESYSKVGASNDGEKRKKLTIKLRLWDDQATAVNSILAEVQAQMGFKDPADAFEHIIMEWAAEHEIAVSKPKKVKKVVEAAPVAKAKAGRRTATA